MNSGDTGPNRLLRSLDAPLVERLRQDLEPVVFRPRSVLVEHGQPVSHVYFITAGIVSRIGLTRSGRTLELGCTGREGAAGILNIDGVHKSPYRIIAQLHTEALRIDTSVLCSHALQSSLLLQRIFAYGSVLITQLAQSAICARFHTSDQRLCRWLATAAKRAEVSRLPWSHEWIAGMVGGPRSGVSQAAAALRRLGLVEYDRSEVIVRDVTGLSAKSCECLRVVDDAIDKFLVNHAVE